MVDYLHDKRETISTNAKMTKILIITIKISGNFGDKLDLIKYTAIYIHVYKLIYMKRQLFLFSYVWFYTCIYCCKATDYVLVKVDFYQK